MGTSRRGRWLAGLAAAAALALFRFVGGGPDEAPVSETDPAATGESADGERDEVSGAGLAPCPAGDGPEGALCRAVEVREDPDDPEGRTIPLRVMVLPAEEEGAADDPVFILAGGPGQAATDLAMLVGVRLPEVVRTRDIVLVDQRGTGASNQFTCSLFEEEPSISSETGLPEIPEAEWRECLAELDAAPEHYTTPVAMDDLETVRRALGYGRINLWGGSYGTRAALVYLRRHPDSVRAAVLDGVAPVDMRIPLSFAADGQRALNLLLAGCAEDPGCSARFPRLPEMVDELLASLDHDPPRRFRVRHARTGEWEERALRREEVAGILRALLYNPSTSSLTPLMVESALDGDFGPLLVFADPASGPQIAPGMFLSVLCAEDLPFVGEGEAEAAAEETVFGGFMVEAMREACRVWPRGELPPGYREAVASDAPVLILSGELDPVTPPRWGEHAAKTLSRSRHLVVPGAAHGTLGSGCAPRLVAEFLDSADPDALDASCLEALDRPAFWRSATGPDLPPTGEEGERDREDDRDDDGDAG